ncbi:MAG: UDP-galactopyranose mutase, partial [Alphaproteobacteria bacterium]|nr:UDP-galactopyranose mutase [Alphaproteobacteria bacterium]
MHDIVGVAPRSTSDAAPRWLICFSHLRWNFVYQRPQHLLSRAAQSWRIVIWEEPEFGEAVAPMLRLDPVRPSLLVATPLLPADSSDAECITTQRRMLDFFIAEQGITDPLLWYYTPQALPFSDHLRGSALIYDCMDELSAFRGADPALSLRERDLLARADLVFTGGFSLYEVKRQQHRSVHPFPSGVDVAHFLPARTNLPEPADQAGIPRPRLGFYGVLDERLDRELLAGLADAKPAWQFVMIGPVAKIDAAELPQRPNIHYLGGKQYTELPSYVSGWDVALILFARNEATRFISPTKTPEYLAAGLPVVSTPIVDVVRHYGKSRAVAIAGTVPEFVKAAERALALRRDPASWLAEADQLLATADWDSVWDRMFALIAEAIARRAVIAKPPRARKRVGGPAKSYDTMIVGAGFAGAVLAERLASTGNRVLLLDRRPHVGGNAYDHHNEAGVLVHRYGPHIFHTNSRQILDHLGRFTEWRPYEHRVLARVGDSLLPIPINRTTINRFFGLSLAEAEVAAFLASKAEPIGSVRTAADVVLSTVGRELYQAFFQGYTQKQWGVDPSELDKSVTARIPTRTGDDDRYFTDKFQVMPRHGFTRLFENMLDHPGITLMLGADYRDVQHDITWNRLIYTGPVDEYFDHRYGKLPYRSLRFEHRTLDQATYQPVAVVNYPSADVPYTRVTEFKHLTGQVHPKTSICYEFPTDAGDPYYPVPRPDNAALYAKYQALADATPEVTFVGRLATYRYYNMDQVVGQALATFER